jgi:hypothetical protein
VEEGDVALAVAAEEDVLDLCDAVVSIERSESGSKANLVIEAITGTSRVFAKYWREG